MRQIRNPRQPFAKLFIQTLGRLVQYADPVADRPYLELLLRGIRAGFFQISDLHALRIPLRFELFRFGQSGAPLRVESSKFVQVQCEAARR